MKKYFVYIIKCRDERLYTGITTDIERRFAEHSEGKKGAKFTRANPPEEIMAVWSCDGRSVASKLEYAIKRLKRIQKLQLIEKEKSLSDFFGEEFRQCVMCN
ncbi:MAG: GIY-YIG nuclease family protein [Ruminococcus sp.]|nr:GIY-YIG nuclease family protein [Ruminococcus sp.]